MTNNSAFCMQEKGIALQLQRGRTYKHKYIIIDTTVNIFIYFCPLQMKYDKKKLEYLAFFHTRSASCYVLGKSQSFYMRKYVLFGKL